MKNVYFAFVCLFFSLANSANALTAAEELAKVLKTYETIKGKFTQTLVDAKGELLQESSGVFTVKSPGYFYWDTQIPFPQLLIADLETIWLYDPDLEQVTVSPYSDSIDQSPALLLSGNVEKITANYTVVKSTVLPNSFLLRPNNSSASNFTELQLSFIADVLKTMQLIDSLEQTTTFNFSDIEINQAVENALFSFEPPPGVDILKNE